MRAIVVEVDGESHEKGKQPMKDEHRDEIMKKMGLRVIRFTNEDTFNADKCAERMREEIEKLPLEVRVEALKPAGTYWKTHVRGW